MKPSIAIAIAAALAFSAASLGATAPAAAFSKEELIQKLTRKAGPRTFTVAPQGEAELVVDPSAVKRKKLRFKQELVAQPMIVQPGGNKKIVSPMIVAPSGGIHQKIIAPMIVAPSGGKTQMVVQPMIVAPGGGIKTKPLKVGPQIVQMVAQPQPIIAQPNPDELRRMSNRKIVVEERKELAAIVKQNDLPSVDMEVYFAYNSAAIEPSAFQTLIALGQALSDARLEGLPILIAGHTDATGGDGYNQGLSERRAYAIKSFLVQNFHIDPQSLIAVGYGEEELKDYADPTSGVNRRVQVANLSAP